MNGKKEKVMIDKIVEWINSYFEVLIVIAFVMLIVISIIKWVF